ncbi:MAG TPA: MerR family transcriptional regulator [Candidatus Limnocylindria bacterium]|nr:MerR family transcriptional regulator [Candidatus Limnocylindria bacterium]
MDYTVSGLARLAGVSARTLRYYDAIGLLSPRREAGNGYRLYGPDEVSRLQQILLYREMGMPLEDVRSLVSAPGYDSRAALEKHLQGLRGKRDQLETLIRSVEKTIAASKGEITMTDKERFEGFKKGLIEENESKYGTEVRAKFGDSAVDASNAKLMGVSQEEYARIQDLSARLNERIRQAMEQGDPAGPLAQEAAALHREWLGFYWDFYSKEAHAALAQAYVDDPRFRKYYEDVAPGCAEFLRDAIVVYCGQD